MNELLEIIRSRKSTYPKDYTQDTIPEHVLMEIVNAAEYAPSHKKTDPWEFRIYQGQSKEELARVCQSLYQAHTPPDKFSEKKQLSIADKFAVSQAVVLIILDKSGKVPEWEEVAAVGAAVQNMWLTATWYEVGGYWSSPHYMEYAQETLNLKENQRCLGLFYLGSTDSEFSLREKESKIIIQK